MSVDIPVEMTSSVQPRFQKDCARLALRDIVALKLIRPRIKDSLKYRQIVSTIKAVGLVEPPVVIPSPQLPGKYYVLDGALKLEALKDLDVEEVDCLVATEEDTFTYNKQVVRLAMLQDHRMILSAVNKGVSIEQLATALDLSPVTIRRRVALVHGIDPKVVQRLADLPCPGRIFTELRKMKPRRQMEAVELMISQNSFTWPFCQAIVNASAPSDLVKPTKKVVTLPAMRRLDLELRAIQAQIRSAEDSYGPDVLQFTVIKRYVEALLQKAAIVRWLAKNCPDYLAEFQSIADAKKLPPGRRH